MFFTTPMMRAKLNLKLVVASLFVLSVLAFPSRICVLTASACDPLRVLASSNADPLLACTDGLRGGDATSEEIRTYLDSAQNSRLENFHIQGWRWHTRSLVREAGRLHQLASRTNVITATELKQASEYVLGFNLKGLHKIEADLFFPWMRAKLTSEAPRQELRAAFASVMDQLESDRRMVAQLGDAISKNIILACDVNKPESLRSGAIEDVAYQSSQLEGYARNMMEIENTYLVPAIAELVPEGEQMALNNKVLMNLGLLDSRLHLVGMHEAVWATNDSTEKELFRRSIPSIPQMMIPRWKRKLYDPKTYML